MLIAQILYSGLGGHAAVARSLATEFRRQQHGNALLFYGVEPLWESSRTWCEDQQLDYACVIKRPGFDWRAWVDLDRQLQKWTPDLILCHGPASLPAVLFYAWRTGCRWFLRDTQVHQGKTSIEKLLTWSAAALAGGVIFLTIKAARETLWGPLRRVNHRVIPNGLELSRYIPRPTGPVRRLGMLGRLTPGKEVEVLLRAFQLVADAGLELVIAGDGPSRPALQRWVVERGLDQRVCFLGAIETDAVPGFLSSLDIYCHTTRGETMSTSIMQAMATGLPIIASDVAGVNNMLSGDGTALLVPPSDPASLASAIVRLARDHSLRKRLSDAARTEALQNYCCHQQARRYLEFFQCSDV